MTLPARARSVCESIYVGKDGIHYNLILAALEATRREALEVPAVWSGEECDGMEAAYRNASEHHGHYESLFATVAWLLRYRSGALLDAPRQGGTEQTKSPDPSTGA